MKRKEYLSMEMIVQILLLAVGFVMLVKGADWFVDGASGIAEKFHIPQLIIGLTIVAMGTSAPEAAVSISAAIKGNADITIGNIVGSNILNILIILGLSSVITALAVAKSTVKFEIPIMIAITGLLLVQGLDGTIRLIDGIILVAAFIGYLTYLFVMAKRDPNMADAPAPQNKPLWQALLFTVIGLVLIVWGSNVAVDAASAIARLPSRAGSKRFHTQAAIIAPAAPPDRAAFHRREPMGTPNAAQAPTAVPSNGIPNPNHIPTAPLRQNFSLFQGMPKIENAPLRYVSRISPCLPCLALAKWGHPRVASLAPSGQFTFRWPGIAGSEGVKKAPSVSKADNRLRAVPSRL